MKFVYLAIIPFLSACASSKAHWEPQIEKHQEEIDATPSNILKLLEKKGYKDALLTGLRNELCEDDHFVIGFGVLLKQVDNQGNAKAVSATVCLDFDNQIFLIMDKR